MSRPVHFQHQQLDQCHGPWPFPWVAVDNAWVSSDAASLVLQGLQTLDVRLAEQGRRAFAVANLLRQQASAQRVICPHHPDDRQHERFSHCSCGGNGLVSVILEALSDERVTSMVEGFRMSRIGTHRGIPHAPAGRRFRGLHRSAGRDPRLAGARLRPTIHRPVPG